MGPKDRSHNLDPELIGAVLGSKRLDYINTRVQYIPIEWTISPYYWTNRSNNYWVQWNGPSVGPEEWT